MAGNTCRTATTIEVSKANLDGLQKGKNDLMRDNNDLRRENTKLGNEAKGKEAELLN